MEFQQNLIKLNQAFTTKEEAIRYCGRQLVQAGHVNEAYIEAMIERNQELSVYMGNFIAIPHGTDEAKRKSYHQGLPLFRYQQVLTLVQKKHRRLRQFSLG